jgi:hypothetical protein
LEDAGIELDWVATDALGASGRAMLATLVAGLRDTGVLVELANGRLRPTAPATAVSSQLFPSPALLQHVASMSSLNSISGGWASLAQMTKMTTRTKRVTGMLLVSIITCGHLSVAL